MEIFYKITDENKPLSRSITHNKLSTNGNNIYQSHRFKFTTIEYIKEFYHHGTVITVIKIPKNNPEFSILPDPIRRGQWRANKIIIGKKFSLYDPKTYKLFGLKMSDNDYIVNFASLSGNVDFLKWWVKSDVNLSYTNVAMNMASRNGHVHVLDWWLKSCLRLKYTSESMDSASIHGRENVLEWWKNSGLQLKYSHCSINGASKYNRVNILEWWKNAAINSGILSKISLDIFHENKTFGIELMYTEDAVDDASANGHKNILEWWFMSGLKIKYSDNAIRLASENGHKNILDWWLLYVELQRPQNTTNCLCKKKNIWILEWFENLFIKKN